LKRDCFNVNAFFSKILDDDQIIPLQDLFTFLITPTFHEHSEVSLPSKDQELSRPEETRLSVILNSSSSTKSPQIDDSVFLQTWVPSSLAEAGDLYEIERIMSERSKGVSSVYDTLLNTPTNYEEQESDEEDDEDDSESVSSNKSDSCSEVSDGNGNDGHRPENMSRQEWKKLVKEQNRERRKNKVPKFLKNKRNLKKYGCK